jgi:hypothetical protein
MIVIGETWVSDALFSCLPINKIIIFAINNVMGIYLM